MDNVTVRRLISILCVFHYISGITCVNNNDPQFDYFPSPITIPEDTPIGTKVFSCNATDADGSANLAGQLRFLFNTPDNQVAQKWLINSRPCELFVYTKLDYEAKPQFNLGINVTDLDPTAPKTVKLTLTINIADVNDNKPACAEYFKVISLVEDFATSTEISEATATCADGDADKSTNGKLLYKISDSNDLVTKDKFQVGLNSGKLMLKNTIDYETRPTYEVAVDAYDNGNPSFTTVVTFTVDIEDIDDNKPTWPTNPILETVNELESLDTTVFAINAVDADKPNTLASTIKYGIVTPGSPDWFDIDRETGAISVKGVLNYNIAPFVILEVLAYSSDKVGEFSTVIVNISLTDENTEAPEFQQVLYRANITENSASGTPVVTVLAVDPEHKDVEYFLSSPNFAVDPATGTVTTTSNTIDFEQAVVFSLQIEARDTGVPSQSGYAFLLFNVLPENEYEPVISGPSSSIDLPEDTEPGFILVNITATDDDHDLDGIVTFSIQNELDPFTIEPTTGILRVSSTLDREQQALWEIVVISTDSSETDPKSSSITITINLEDVNDNEPVCDPLPSVVVTLPHVINGDLATIQCNDEDTGVNSEFIYTKMSGDDSNSFNVDGSTGVITLANTPNQTEYIINIVVQDKGDPVQQTIVVFRVIAELQFSLLNLPHSVNFPENTNLAVELYDVNDCCVFSLTHYEITGGNEDNHVIIDPSSGKVILMNSFDRETKDTFTYIIRATAIDTNTVAESHLNITVHDYNDITPKFDTTFQYVSVSEDLPPGTSITQIIANDLDIGINSDISYSISAGNIPVVFGIDSTGNLNLLSGLDAETTTLYSLTILAKDGGSPQLIGITNIDIEVKNVNDFNPQILNIVGGVAHTDVFENETLGAPIISLIVTDEDINTVFTYSITNGNTNESFVIDVSSGDIFLAKLLDRENTPQYNLTVEVKTNSNETVTALIVIDVLDVNDKDPKFVQDVYQLEVTHDDPADKLITTFIITDDDIGINQDIVSVTITDGNSNNHFKIVGQQILTNSKIDYYTTNLYSLTLQTVDGGDPSRSGYARVNIKVNPIFLPPKFLLTDYTKLVPENINSVEVVLDLNATADGGTEGVSGTIRYSIRSGNDGNKYYIGDYTGIIKIASDLDFETTEQFILIIDAASREDPSLSASTTVTIDIKNVNDNVPVFSKNVYNFIINEDIGVSDSVGNVEATDADKAPHGTVSYSLGTAAGSSDFIIESSGIIKVNKSLDYRRQNIYNIPIIASDGSKSETSLAVITVNDVNNNSPTFTPATRSIEVQESVGTGVTIFTVTAEDLDTGLNSAILYTLVSGNYNSQLGFDTNSGALTVDSSLDREANSIFNLVIRAEDTGGLSGTLDLTVNVADINDQDPSFPKTLEDSTINRNDLPGTVVLTVAATDGDIGSNAAIVYEITGGNTDGLFIIGVNTGAIKTASSVTLAENEYTLQVTAKDKGSPVRTGTMDVRVMITPLKVFGPSEQTMQLYEGLPVATLAAVTGKSGHAVSAVIEFSITGGNFKNNFGIDKDTGMISVLNTLDREEYPSYILSIDISDDNGVSYTKTVSINVLDINDNDPVITTSDTTVNVVENTPGGQIIAAFTLSDQDEGDNAVVDLELSSTPSDFSDIFELSSTLLKLKKPLDFETKTSYTLKVLAKDRGSSQRTGSIVLTINVLNIDDSNTYITGARELPSVYISREASFNSIKGDKMTQLTASDFGKDSNIGQTTFSSLNREGIFVIDNSGSVTVQKAELLVAGERYYVWVVATTKNAVNTTSILGLLRIDTFDPNLYVASLESTADPTNLDTNRNAILSSITVFFPPEDVPKIWKIQSYEVNSRRKLLAAGSQILVYVLEGPVSEDIADFESPKKFKPMNDIVDALRMVPTQEVPQPGLSSPTYPIVAVNGYSEPMVPRTQPVTQPDDSFAASTEGYITFGLIALIIVGVIIILVVLYKKKKKKSNVSGSSENLVYTDDNNLKKVALIIPKGIGKKNSISNKTTRRTSLGPASTSLPAKPKKKKSTTIPPPAPSASLANTLTPVQNASDDTKVAIPNLDSASPTPAKSPKPAKRALPLPRNAPVEKPADNASNKDSNGIDKPLDIPNRRNGPVVHRGKEYDGVGFDNGKKYAYNTRTGSTLWVENDNSLGDKNKINKKKAAPKLTVVSEASVSASPNLSARNNSP